MRTTLSIADDVLAVARAIARRDRSSIGDVITDLVRQSLHPGAPVHTRNGVALLPISKRGAVVTADIVNRLRDEIA